MRHLIDPLDFTQQEISLCSTLPTASMTTRPRIRRWPGIKKLATLFYEPSTAPASL